MVGNANVDHEHWRKMAEGVKGARMEAVEGNLTLLTSSALQIVITATVVFVSLKTLIYFLSVATLNQSTVFFWLQISGIPKTNSQSGST